MLENSSALDPCRRRSYRFLDYADGQLKEKIEYDNDGTTVLARTKYEYNKDGQLSKVQQLVDGSTWTSTVYEYKSPQEEQFTANVDSVATSFDQRITDAEGRFTYYKHDVQGRVTMILYSDGRREYLEYYVDGKKKSRSVYDRTGDHSYASQPNHITYGTILSAVCRQRSIRETLQPRRTG